MSRARNTFAFALIGALSTTVVFWACGSSGDGPGSPTQTASTITVALAATDPILSLGDTRGISAVAKDASGATLSSPAITWSSSAPGVATVAGTGGSATITAVGNGSATITASSGSAQATASVTVAQKATAVGIGGAPTLLIPGATAQLTADARDAKGRGVAGVTGFTYTSSDQSVAVVNATGNVIAISPGTTTIGSSVTVNGTALSGTTPLTVAFASANPNQGSVSATDANQFTPSTLTIAVGGNVTWTFGSVQHTVTFGSTTGAPSSIAASSGQQVSRTFPTAGSFDYDCTLHPGMHGVVVVQPSTVAPAYIAILNGANERPASVTTTGAGAASFIVNGTTVSYTVTFSRLTAAPIMSHIHAPGTASQTAAVLVDFPTAGQTFNNGVLTGSFNASAIRNPAISLDSLFKLMGNGNAYVNVHTPLFPAGEIRGQVSVPN